MTIRNTGDTTAIGLVTDCTGSEIKQFWGQPAINSDDCLALYEWLEKPLQIKQLRT